MSGVFLDERPTTYTDNWETYRANFTTGPLVPANGDKVANVSYLTVFAKAGLNHEMDVAPSCFVQGRWDWYQYSPTNTGKWTTPQQVYTTNRFDRSTSRKRLLMRGSGPALQLYFEDEADAPFELIAWTIQETADAVA